MKILTALGLTSALVMGLAVSNPVPAKADGGFITGLIVGGVAGHVITRHHDGYFDRHYSRHRHHYRAYNRHSRKHVNWCHRKYRSYKEWNNTWVSYPVMCTSAAPRTGGEPRSA